MDRLRTEQHPGVWHSEGSESDGVGGEVWFEMVTEGGRRFMASWEIRGRRG